MTIKEAVLKILEETPKAYSSREIYDLVIERKMHDFGDAKTPKDSVNTECWNFIKRNDSRVKRIKFDEGPYLYYHAKYEAVVLADSILSQSRKTASAASGKKAPNPAWNERSLHALLCAFLNSDSDDNFTKTIRHQTSSQKNDDAQTWIHPDMVNLRLQLPREEACRSLLNSLRKNDSIVLSSYELKRSIHSDYELKHYFFQAVSNSSWANYGWLVALDIDESKLREEMERLNRNFGIGIIHLKPNAFNSRILYPAKYRPLDFRTIDKLCGINPDLREFIDHVVKLINAQKGYVDSTKAAFRQFCDKVLKTDAEIERYCQEQLIPIDPDDE